MNEVWLVSRIIGGCEWEANGIYADRASALAACADDQTQAVRFTLGEDVTRTETFFAISNDCPDGKWI